MFYISSAREVWEKLKIRFSQPDNVRIYQLQQQLGTITQGTRSVGEYFTQLNAVWEELRNYRPLPCCSCGLYSCKALSSIGEVQISDYILKFLMGLNDSYESIRGQILLMSPIPSLDKTFSMIIQEERQREARTLTLLIAEFSALAVVNNRAKRKDKMDISCQHCGKSGHTREKCYGLVGFPPNFKFTKTKQGHYSNNTFTPPQAANQVLSQTQQHEEMPQLLLLQDQIQKLMALVNGKTP